MNFDLPPLGRVDGAASPPPTRGVEKGAGFGSALSKAVDAQGIPASPPAEVLEEMHGAARVADALRAQGRELHFEASDGHVVVQVRDLASGNVIRNVPPREALDIATGASRA